MPSDNNIIKNWVIYKITSPSNRVYIGKTSNLKMRIYPYKSGKCNGQRLLFESIKKYGFDNHILDVIDEFSSNNPYANDKEMFWVRSFMSNKYKYPKQNGLNLTDGGDGSVGAKRSDEFKRHVSEHHKKNPNSTVLKPGNIPWNKGKKTGQIVWNKGVKGIIVSPKKGKKIEMTEEERYERYVKPHLGFPSWSKGKKMKPEWVEKMASKKRGVSNYKLKKRVNQFNLNNELIASYDSVTEAASISGAYKSGISRCMTGELRSCFGFIFKYA